MKPYHVRRESLNILVTVVINAPPTPRPNLEMLSSKPLDVRVAISIEFIVTLKENQESFNGKSVCLPSWGRVVSASEFAFNRNHTVPVYVYPSGRRQLGEECTKF